MRKYEIVTNMGNKIYITEAEYKAMAGKTGLLFFPSCETTINSDSIKLIRPEEDEKIDRKQQIDGVLHDGSRVKRHFGMWVDATNQVPDDKGNYVPVRIDPAYYPEVAMDCVPTPQEWEQKYKHVKSGEELIALMTGKDYEEEKIRLGETSFNSTGNLIKKYGNGGLQ